MSLNKIAKQMLNFNPATTEELTAHTGNNAIHTTQAEKDKLAGIATNANNYTHPANHSPSIITQDSNNRFVSDTEKADWNTIKQSGTTASRPVPTFVGQFYFDTTLGKPVYAKVLSPATWVDATGVTV